MQHSQVIETLDRLIPTMVDSGDPEGTLLKKAEADKWSPAQLEKVAQFFNIAKTVTHMDKHPDRRGSSVTLLDVPDLLSKYAAFRPTQYDVEKSAGAEEEFFDDVGMEFAWALKGRTGPVEFPDTELGKSAYHRTRPSNGLEAKTNRRNYEDYAFNLEQDARDALHKIAKRVRFGADLQQADFEARGLLGEAADPACNLLRKMAAELNRPYEALPLRRQLYRDSTGFFDGIKTATEKLKQASLTREFINSVFGSKVENEKVSPEALLDAALGKSAYVPDIDDLVEQRRRHLAAGGPDNKEIRQALDLDKLMKAPNREAVSEREKAEREAERRAEKAERQKEKLDREAERQQAKIDAQKEKEDRAREKDEELGLKATPMADTREEAPRETFEFEVGKGPEIQGALETAFGLRAPKALSPGYNREQESVDDAYMSAKLEATLQHLLMTDSTLAEASDAAISNATNSIINAAPDIANHPAELRYLLREVLQYDGEYGNVPPHIIRDLQARQSSTVATRRDRDSERSRIYGAAIPKPQDGNK